MRLFKRIDVDAIAETPGNNFLAVFAKSLLIGTSSYVKFVAPMNTRTSRHLQASNDAVRLENKINAFFGIEQ